MKLRLSYSFLSAWLRGNPQEAVEIYFRVPRGSSKEMEDGRKLHKDIQTHIETYNSFPEWLFSGSLTLPACEMKVEVPYSDQFDLVGIFDCYDNPTLYEFKSGVQLSTDWARTEQLPLYFLIAEINKIEIEKAYLIHYDQYDKKRDFTLVWNTPKLRDKARNMIDSVAPDILSYFQKEGLISEH